MIAEPNIKGATIARSLTDLELARQIAETAGQLLLTLRGSGLWIDQALGKAGDQLANTFIMAALKSHRPNDAILCEEERDDPARLTHERVWIVDPLDGTREYGEARADWAVHVALAINGTAALGAVALPGLGITCTSGDAPIDAKTIGSGHGRTAATDPPPAAATAGALRMVVSRTRPPPVASRIAAALGAELVPMGSAGAKILAVVRGSAEIYLHAGGQYEWDSCAPVAVAQYAGLHVSRLDGSPLRYNQSDAYLPDLLVCSQQLAARVLELVALGSSPSHEDQPRGR